MTMGIKEFFRGKIAESDRLTDRDIQKEWNSGTDQKKNTVVDLSSTVARVRSMTMNYVRV